MKIPALPFITRITLITALTALGACNKSNTATRTTPVKIIAFDEDPRTLQAIDKGEIYGTVVQKPYEFGYQSITALRALIIEKKSEQDLGVPESKQKFIETLIIRKGEGENYLEKCNEWKKSAKQRAAASDSTSKTKLAFVTNASADFWAYAEAGIAKAVAEFDDIEVEFKVGDGTAAKQRELVEALLVRGVKGIAISPCNPKGQKDMLNEWTKKAALITVDSDAAETGRKFYLGTDNVAAGRQAGELLKEALPDGGKVMAFVGLGDQANAVERYQGLKEAVAGTKIEILDLRTDEVDFGKARRNAEDTLTKYPDIAGMVGLWSYNGPLILEAVKDKGLADGK